MAIGVSGLGAVMRGLRGDLHEADDRQLTKIVAMLDRLDNRGEADALIAALRPRLAHLRLPRRHNLTRIMFMPFDPLVVAAADWTRESLALPRSILRSLVDIVRAHAPDRFTAIDATLADDRPAIAGEALRIGRVLWPLAAEALQSATMPGDWQFATGLRPADFPTLCRTVAAILHHAPATLHLVAADAVGVPPSTAEIARFMAPFASGDVRTMATLIAILNLRLPHIEAIRQLNQVLNADLGATPLRMAADQAFDYILGALETAAAPPVHLDQAVVEVTRLAAMVDTQSLRTFGRPTQAARVAKVRSRLDMACRAQFADLLTSQVLVPLDWMAEADDAAIEAAENDARALRRFDQAARQLGGAASYDQALRAGGEHLRPRYDDSATTRIDKLRLAEILLGSTAAAQLG